MTTSHPRMCSVAWSSQWRRSSRAAPRVTRSTWPSPSRWSKKKETGAGLLAHFSCLAFRPTKAHAEFAWRSRFPCYYCLATTPSAKAATRSSRRALTVALRSKASVSRPGHKSHDERYIVCTLVHFIYTIDICNLRPWPSMTRRLHSCRSI